MTTIQDVGPHYPIFSPRIRKKKEFFSQTPQVGSDSTFDPLSPQLVINGSTNQVIDVKPLAESSETASIIKSRKRVTPLFANDFSYRVSTVSDEAGDVSFESQKILDFNYDMVGIKDKHNTYHDEVKTQLQGFL